MRALSSSERLEVYLPLLEEVLLAGEELLARSCRTLWTRFEEIPKSLLELLSTTA